MGEVRVAEVIEGLYLLRAEDHDLKFFEALWAVPEGVTYNSYLPITDEHRVLFDGWKADYAGEFVEAVGEIVDPRDLDYVVVHHAEPDHSGSLPRLLEANGGRATVLGHTMAGRLLEGFYRLDARFRAVGDGERLRLGEETLTFVHTPWLHWPDTIMTYLEGSGVLLSGDAFGGFSVPDALFDDEADVPGYIPYVRKYAAAVIGRYLRFLRRALEKVRALGKVRAVAPAHGLVFRRAPEVIVGYYEKLASGVPEEGKVLVVYGSMYGFVEAAVLAAVAELRKAGARPVVHRFTSSCRADLGEVVSDAIDSQAVIVGVSTYEAGVFPPMRQVVEVLAKKTPPKPVLIVSAYGWGGAAARLVRDVLSKAGFDVRGVVEFRGAPSAEDLGKVRELALGLLEG